MNINYRQVLIIVSVLILFELMSVGLKKCSSNDTNETNQDNTSSVFPLPLNDSTKFLLYGDWKMETTSMYDSSNFRILHARFKKESLSIWHYNLDLHYKTDTYQKWSLENGQVKIDQEYAPIWKAQIFFYNEDEFNAFDTETKKWEKWIRISETKHPYLYNNSK